MINKETDALVNKIEESEILILYCSWSPKFKIRIKDENEEANALEVLLNKGKGEVFCYKNNIYGLVSKEQLDLLKDRKISYEIVR